MSAENNKQNKEHIKLQVSRRRRGCASRAYWPPKMRAYTLTSKPAQRHRMLTLHIMGGLDHLGILQLNKYIGLSGPITIIHIVQMALILSFIGVIMILSTFYQWSHVVMLAVLCILTTIVVTQLLFKQEPAQQASDHRFVSAQSEQLNPKSVQNNQPHTFTHFFPDTPMPATPLIRVLETIDLSSTNVEHFLDISAQTPPRTEVDIDSATPNLPEAFYQRSPQEDG